MCDHIWQSDVHDVTLTIKRSNMNIIDLCLHLQTYTTQSIEYGTKITKKLEIKYIDESSNMYYRHQSNAT